jgi:hypothetical protein
MDKSEMKNHSDRLVSDAEQKIAKILCALELQINATIESMDLASDEITTFSDSNRQILQRVKIEVFRVPGNNWAVRND